MLWLPTVLGDPDTLWHIAVGQWILAHASVPSVDTFSYTAEGRPWVAHEWLSEVILALAYRLAGWNGIIIVAAAAAALAAGIVAHRLQRSVRTDVALMIFALLTVACACPSLLARPHLIALPCLALWTAALVAARASRTTPSLALLLPLMVLWANLHGSFLVGLVLAGALTAEALFDPALRRRDTARTWGIFLSGAVAAASVTPHGIDGLLFPFRLMAMKDLSQIAEWQPSDLGHLTGLTVSILAALYLGLTGGLRLPKFRVLMISCLLFAAMQHSRHGQVFGVMVPLLIADALGRSGWSTPSTKIVRLERLLAGVMILSAIASLSVRIVVPMHRADEGYYASVALDNLPVELRTRHVLNEYGFGGLLIFSGIRPFIDGRADLYGDSRIDTYAAITNGVGHALDKALCQYDIRWTFFRPESLVPSLMDRTPGWHRLYADKVAVIHVRDSTNEQPNCGEP